MEPSADDPNPIQPPLAQPSEEVPVPEPPQPTPSAEAGQPASRGFTGQIRELLDMIKNGKHQLA